MPPTWLRPRSSTPPWDAVRDRLQQVGGLAVSGPDEPPVAAWTDGPGPETVAAAIGPPAGWTLVAGPPGGDVAAAGPVLHLDRTLSDPAVAVCLVRFYASRGRHWHSDDSPAHQEVWRTLTGADDPQRCPYPIPAAIAGLLLEAPDPPGLPGGPTRADVLSAKLAAVGYERLWAVAFARVS